MYAKFADEEEADDALKGLAGRFYAGRVLEVQILEFVCLFIYCVDFGWFCSSATTRQTTDDRRQGIKHQTKAPQLTSTHPYMHALTNHSGRVLPRDGLPGGALPPVRRGAVHLRALLQLPPRQENRPVRPALLRRPREAFEGTSGHLIFAHTYSQQLPAAGIGPEGAENGREARPGKAQPAPLGLALRQRQPQPQPQPPVGTVRGFVC